MYRRVRIVTPLQDNPRNYNNKKIHMSCVTCHVSQVMCHLSCVTSHLSAITCHLTTTLCSFSCQESCRRFCDATADGLVIDRVDKNIFLGKSMGTLKILIFGFWSFISHPYSSVHKCIWKDTQSGLFVVHIPNKTLPFYN